MTRISSSGIVALADMISMNADKKLIFCRDPLYLICLFCIVFLPLASMSPALADLQDRIGQFIHDENLGQTKVAIVVRDLDRKVGLVWINGDSPMIPASNMKLLTTAAALTRLGSTFVFRTELRLLRPANATQGFTVLVHGDGDPALGDTKLLQRYGLQQPGDRPTIYEVEDLLQAWVEAVRCAGVVRIDRLLINDHIFDKQFVHPSWPKNQLHRWYCAQVAGLNFHNNCLDIYPEPGSRIGAAPLIRVVPEVPNLDATNRAQTGTIHTFWIDRITGTNKFTYRAKVKYRARKPAVVTIHDPPMMFARIFADRLRRAGVAVMNIDRAPLDSLLPDGQILHVVQTPLPLVLERCNKNSQNLFAEAILKRLGRHETGAQGSWLNGTAAVRIFLNDRLGPDSAVTTVSDGSGLSRENRVTAQLVVNLLAAMHDDVELGPVYRDSLAISGEQGSLENRLRELNGKVYGKTGYINGVSCLSGYLVIPSDCGPRSFSFSFLFNGFKPPVYLNNLITFQDKLLKLIDGQLILPKKNNSINISG